MSGDSFSEVTNQSWGSRLKGVLIAVAIGAAVKLKKLPIKGKAPGGAPVEEAWEV